MSFFSDEEPATASTSIPPPAAPPGGAEEDSSRGRSSSAAAASSHSVLPQKRRLAPQKGDVSPSALPQNLLPLLGRGLTVSSLHGSHAPELQKKEVKPPESAAAPGQGGRPTPPTDSQPPRTQTPPLELEADSTMAGSVLDGDVLSAGICGCFSALKRENLLFSSLTIKLLQCMESHQGQN